MNARFQRCAGSVAVQDGDLRLVTYDSQASVHPVSVHMRLITSWRHPCSVLAPTEKACGGRGVSGVGVTGA